MRTSDSGDGGPTTYAANLECPMCGTLFEGVWVDESIDAQQLDEPPIGEQVCPACGHDWEEEYPGWNQYGYA